MSIKHFAEYRRKQRTKCLRERKLKKLSERRKRNNRALEDYTVQKHTLQKPKRKDILVVLYER
jgi:hypothetical protein